VAASPTIIELDYASLAEIAVMISHDHDGAKAADRIAKDSIRGEAGRITSPTSTKGPEGFPHEDFANEVAPLYHHLHYRQSRHAIFNGMNSKVLFHYFCRNCFMAVLQLHWFKIV
jgi:hypothetical protein